MSIEDTFNFFSKQIHIYYGLFILVFGVIGGILNVIIFTTLKTFRETICGFYLTILSIVSTGHLLTAVLVRVLSEGFSTNIRRISWVCKIQIYLVGWCLLVSMTIMCLAAIDQYISISRYRQYSNKRFGKRAIILTCIFWSLYCICLAIYWGTSSGICMIINPIFSIYSTSFHFPIILGFLPLTTMTIFSLLAFYRVRTLVGQQINIIRLSRDRQLTVMTLCHVAFVVITQLPFIVYFIYSSNQITSENLEQIARNNLIYSITLLINYSSFAGSFYIYFCASERFRKQFLYVLTKIYIDNQRQLIANWNQNQIVPHIESINNAQSLKANRVDVEINSIQ